MTMNAHTFIAHLQFKTFQVIGLAPLTLKEQRSFSNSKMMNYYNLGLLASGIILCAYILTSPMWIFLASQRNSIKFIFYLIKTGFYCAIVTGLIIQTVYCTRQLKIRRLANRLMNLRAIPSTMGTIYQFKGSNNRANFFYFTHLAFSIVFIVFNLLHGHLGIEVYVTIMLHAIVTWYILQYALVLNFVKDRVQGVNTALRRLTKLPNRGKSRVSPYEEHKRPICGSDELLLLRLLDAEDDFYDLCMNIADFYSFPTLFAVITIIINTIMTAFWTVLPFIDPEWPESDFVSIGSVIANCQLNLFPLICLSTTVGALTSEIMQPVDIVHKLTARFRISEDTKIRITNFFLVLQHRGIKFTSCGCLKLDNSLLQMIAGSIATNLIMIVQHFIDEIDREQKAKQENQSTTEISHPTLVTESI